MMATRPDYALPTAGEFLDIDFGESKAGPDNGVIRMMAGNTAGHAQAQGDVYSALRLRRSGCALSNSDMAARTSDYSIRYLDVTVYGGRGGPANDDLKPFDNPRVVFEVLSASTARTDLRVEREEYEELPSVDTVVFVDIAAERLRAVQRAGPNGWSELIHQEPATLALTTLRIELTHEEIFARD